MQSKSINDYGTIHILRTEKHNRFLDPPSLNIHLGQCPSSLHVHIFPSLYVIEQDATDVLHLLKTSK